MKTLLVMYVLSGGLLSLLGIPLMLRRIPPNPLYGFRVPKSLSDARIWYEINAYSGAHLLWIGAGMIAVSAGLSLVPGISLNTYATLCGLYMLGALGLSLY